MMKTRTRGVLSAHQKKRVLIRRETQLVDLIDKDDQRVTLHNLS